MGSQVIVKQLPDCDIHADGTPALYDARLPGKGGSWGYVCQLCFDAFGPGQLGTGHGQKLIVREREEDVLLREAEMELGAGAGELDGLL